MAEEVKNKNGVEFDIDAIVTDLNGKADKDLANININSAVFARKLKEAGINYVVNAQVSDDDDYSWYRIWSDGWCEQGGICLPNTIGWNSRTVKFLKPFTSINYTITVASTLNSDAINNNYGHCNVIFPNLDDVTLNFYASTASGKVWWQASGYIR
jgi:hypothetical protein